MIKLFKANKLCTLKISYKIAIPILLLQTALVFITDTSSTYRTISTLLTIEYFIALYLFKDIMRHEHIVGKYSVSITDSEGRSLDSVLNPEVFIMANKDNDDYTIAFVDKDSDKVLTTSKILGDVGHSRARLPKRLEDKLVTVFKLDNDIAATEYLNGFLDIRWSRKTINTKVTELTGILDNDYLDQTFNITLKRI